MANTRITTGMTQRNILADLNRVNERLVRTQQKVASNKEITRPSDDPFNTSRALALRTSLDGTQQYQRNIEDAQGWQETAEQALNTITEAIHRAHELATQGATDTTDANAREAIAHELDQLIESVKQSANTTYRGRYVFSGTTTDVPPYGTTDAYAGSATDIERQIGPGVAITLTLVGSTVLGGSCQRDPSGCGVVYRATPPADGQTVWTAKALKSFDGQSEGRQPASKLVVGPDGALCGATSAGGAGGAGTVWRLK